MASTWHTLDHYPLYSPLSRLDASTLHFLPVFAAWGAPLRSRASPPCLLTQCHALVCVCTGDASYGSTGCLNLDSHPVGRTNFGGVDYKKAPP